MKSKTHLIYCSKHGFALYHEWINVTAVQTTTCGCLPSKTIKSLKEVKQIVSKNKYPTWVKSLTFKDLSFYILGYRNHFWRLQHLKYKLQNIWHNLTNLSEER